MKEHPIEAMCRKNAQNTSNSEFWRVTVEQWFIDRGEFGGTADQCHKDMQMLYGYTVEKNSIAPRITELRDAGRLNATGEMRKTRSGKSATVFAHRTFFKPAEKSPQQPLFGSAA